MSKYLIEIGTEELPYHFIPAALEQLKNAFEKSFDDNRIEFGDIKTLGTPRRLTVVVEDISKSQPDMVREVKGPPVKVAYDSDGNPTKALESFISKQNLKPQDIGTTEENGNEFVFARIEEKGRLTSEILKNIVPEIVLSLQGSHFMRWAYQDIKFSRPIRWIVSLLDSSEVKLTIGEVESSRFTRGHRFYQEKEIEIYNPDCYCDELYKAKVIVNNLKRELAVIESAKEAASKHGADVKLEPELVKEVTNLVEWPVPVVGSFDEKYLQIPDAVTITVMASHQRYFPMYKDGKLLNKFITMANFIGDDFDNIVRGNERVIKARLDDAIFFYGEDNKKTLEERVENLKGITFQKGLGSLYDKVERIQALSSFISNSMNLNDEDKYNVERTALLCKSDLTTNLVFEFTELQGFIGSDYARLNGENSQVAKGIKEHYFPVGADAELASTIEGQIVGIADKIDTICGVFAIGKIPTGSGDPLGLRRSALGTLITIINKNLNINLSEIIDFSLSKLPVNIENVQELKAKIVDFVVQRLRVYFTDSYKHDVIESVLSSKNSLENLLDTVKRLEIVNNLVNKPDYSRFHESANRITRLIKNTDFKSSPDGNFFVQDVERQLWDCTRELIDNNLVYEQLVEKLESMIPVIEEFFEKVLVMDKDENIKQNRISLLGNLKAQFTKIADFSKIVA